MAANTSPSVPSLPERLALIAVLLSGAPPLVLYALWMSLSLRVALFIGHWPSFANPAESSLPAPLPRAWLGVVAPAILVTLYLLASAWVAFTRARRSRRFLAAALEAATAWFIAAAILYWDPFGLLAWVLD